MRRLLAWGLAACAALLLAAVFAAWRQSGWTLLGLGLPMC